MIKYENKIDHDRCTQIAEIVVAMFRDKQLELIKVGHSQLDTWMSSASDWALQIRQNLINRDVVSEILEKIRVFEHIDYADPILAIRTKLEGKDGLYLVNGNNTCCALEQVLRMDEFRSLNIKEVSVALIPVELMPKDKENLHETLEQIALMMNQQPKVVRATNKQDMQRLITKDLAERNVDINKLSYKRAKAKSSQMSLRTISEIVAKVRANAKVALTNQMNRFKQLVEADYTHIVSARKTNDNFVQIAALSKKSLFGSFAGAIQHMVFRKHCKSVHIIFHFTKFDDIEELKDWAIEYLEKSKLLVKFDVSYEFLDHLQIIPDRGIQVTLDDGE